MKILNTNDQVNHKIKCLIGGPSGAGKTTLAGTLNEKTLIISAESGLMSVASKTIDYIDLSRDDAGNVLTEPAARIARLSEVFKYLHAGCPGVDGKATWRYKNVFLDSLTEISELLVQKLQKEFPDRKDSFPMWGEYGKIMRSIVKNFRDLPYNVYMSAITEMDKDENNKRFMAFSIAGSISGKLPQYFDEVFFLHVDAEGKRSLVTRATDTLTSCKDRSGRLVPMEPADLGEVARKITVNEEKKS
jgi:energy-coupling factor transporter ATP-binding protein EcfA2